jgi:hypothetical protein
VSTIVFRNHDDFVCHASLESAGKRGLEYHASARNSA